MAEEQQQSTSVRSVIPAGLKNNLVAHLDTSTPRAAHFNGIINFLKRSRIYQAISSECPAYYTHQREFWETAELDNPSCPNEIRGTVRGRQVVISEEQIRKVLGFGDSKTDKIHLNQIKVRGCLLRCGYTGDIERGVINKACLSPEYKYLAHVLLHCLSPRKAGFDQMRETLTNAFAALVMNLPFNFSLMIFVHLTENIKIKKEKYLMYARFVQMLINDQFPELPKEDADIIPLERMTDYTVGSMNIYKSTTRPRDRRLVGHLSNPDYVAPKGKRWRNEGSDSEKEEMEMPEDSDSDVEEHQQRASVEEQGPSTNIPESEVVEIEESQRKRKADEATSSSTKIPKRRKFVMKPLRKASTVTPPPASQPQITPPPQPAPAQ